MVSEILLTLTMPRKKQSKKTFGSKVKSTLLEVDNFPHTLEMQFRKGMASLRSPTGRILTYLYLAVVTAFSITTFSLFASSRKSTTTAAVFEQKIELDEIFGAEQDLNIAVGLDGAQAEAFQRNG